MKHDEPFEDLRAAFEREFEQRRFASALSHYLLTLQHRALHLIRSEGFVIDMNRKPDRFVELVGGITCALDEFMEREGDDNYKLTVARDVLAAVCQTVILLERLRSDAEDETQANADPVAELALMAVRLGVVEVTLGQTLGGFFDEFGRLKYGEHLAKQGRSKGGKASTESKAAKRLQVLPLAQTIIATNPTLPNSEVAFRLKERANLEPTTRTIEGWIRDWRKGGQLPPRPKRSPD